MIKGNVEQTMTTNPFKEHREFKPYSVEQRRVKD